MTPAQILGVGVSFFKNSIEILKLCVYNEME